MKISDGVEHVGEMQWEIALALLISWIVLYFALWKGIKWTGKVTFYRPQHSCGKIMFLHLSVILFTGVCVCVHPSMHWGRHPPGRHIPPCTGADPPPADISKHTLGQTPPADTPVDRHPPGRHPLGRWLLLRTVRILLECIHYSIFKISTFFDLF